ncbi:CheR family methyltransferase [Vulgatibacter incomptus]|uniref:Chemotaxis protein methyltransferase CheR n=1 Tax=Vulgatibacter incomptus TaxID=1391653 RepID=A0A0K1PH13_9BACT|nr:CheR family methyltransferase [Vulgatibacter incomptus]AKU92409.1 Chemotaxis protein methyltransferase CheR [Vulgatibacter incomptus]
MIPVSQDQLASLASILEDRLGFRMGAEHDAGLRMALYERLGASPAPEQIDGYLEALRQSEGELRRLLPLVTVGKTSFYRDERQFGAFRELLPELLRRARAEGRALSIWSAGCATGEETYTLAMELLLEGARPAELELLGTDVNPEAVLAARAGRFLEARSEPIPTSIRERFFELEGGRLQAGPALREVAGFRTQNLSRDPVPTPACGAWDVVFCRNVFIYFSVPTLRRVLTRLHDAIRPGGWLFLGYSESLFRIFDRFELVRIGDSFLYRKPLPVPIATPGPPVQLIVAPVPSPASAAPPIPVAAQMVAPPSPKVPEKSPADFLGRAVELIREGFFPPALALVDEGIGERPGDLALLLTKAHLHVALRDYEVATGCYEAALALEPLSAEAHLFLGVHLMDRGDLERAAAELTRATFLDPHLALGHFFTGRCCERLADLAGARRAYKNALAEARRSRAKSPFMSYYPDLPDDGGISVARAAELSLAAL